MYYKSLDIMYNNDVKYQLRYSYAKKHYLQYEVVHKWITM